MLSIFLKTCTVHLLLVGIKFSVNLTDFSHFVCVRVCVRVCAYVSGKGRVGNSGKLTRFEK